MDAPVGAAAVVLALDWLAVWFDVGDCASAKGLTLIAHIAINPAAMVNDNAMYLFIKNPLATYYIIRTPSIRYVFNFLVKLSNPHIVVLHHFLLKLEKGTNDGDGL